MNGTRNEIASARTAIPLALVLFVLLVLPWHGVAAGGAWNSDLRRVDGFIPVRFIENKPSAELGFRDRAEGETSEVMALIRDGEFDKVLAIAAQMTQSRPNDATGYNLQGIAHLGKRDWTSARKSFEKAVQVNPDNEVAHGKLAQLDIQQKDTAAARKRYQGILAKDRNSVLAMLGLAQLETLRGDEKAALGWFEKAKVARPEAVDPRSHIAAYHIRKRDFKKAIEELADAARVNPANADILSALGQAQLADGQGKAATETMMKLVALRPGAPLAYYQLANAQLAMNDSSGAAKSLTKALQIKPDFVDAAVLLAGLEVRANRYAEALKIAKLQQSVQPGAPAGLVLEGDILMGQKRFADAAIAYQKALAKGPSSPIVAKLYEAQTRSGNPIEADASLQRWLKDHPDDLFALLFAASENIRKGHKKLAIEQYQRVLQKDATNLAALNNLAALYHEVGDRRALQTAEAAYKINQQSPVIADTLGWILVEQGEIARGLELLKSALAREPKNPEIRYHLAVGLAKSGDKVNARKELEALLTGAQVFPQRDAAQALLKQL